MAGHLVIAVPASLRQSCCRLNPQHFYDVFPVDRSNYRDSRHKPPPRHHPNRTTLNTITANIGTHETLFQKITGLRSISGERVLLRTDEFSLRRLGPRLGDLDTVGPLAGGHLAGDEPSERVDVRARPAVFAGKVFGRGVGGRAEQVDLLDGRGEFHHTGDARGAEIDDFHRAGPVDSDVVGPNILIFPVDRSIPIATDYRIVPRQYDDGGTGRKARGRMTRCGSALECHPPRGFPAGRGRRQKLAIFLNHARALPVSHGAASTMDCTVAANSSNSHDLSKK